MGYQPKYRPQEYLISSIREIQQAKKEVNNFSQIVSEKLNEIIYDRIEYGRGLSQMEKEANKLGVQIRFAEKEAAIIIAKKQIAQVVKLLDKAERKLQKELEDGYQRIAVDGSIMSRTLT